MRPGLIALTRPYRALMPFALALAVPACGTREPPRRVHTESTAHVPGDLLYYAHVLYGGETAYLVEGRWYRPGSNGWVVFDQEPLELEMLRRTLESE
jgi:hypothetical protein